MIRIRGSVQEVEVLLHRLFGSEKPYQGLGPKVLKQLEGREVNGTRGGGCSEAGCECCSEAGCEFCSLLPLCDCSLVVHRASKEMCANVPFVPLYFP